jgi:hypothetical protein
MKAQTIKALDTIARLSCSNKEQIILNAHFYNDMEFEESTKYLEHLEFIKASREQDEYSITEFGLNWLISTQSFSKTTNYHEIIYIAIDIIKRLDSLNRSTVSRDSLLKAFSVPNTNFAEEAINLLVTESILNPEGEGSQCYDFIVDNFFNYLLKVTNS